MGGCLPKDPESASIILQKEIRVNGGYTDIKGKGDIKI